MDYRSYEWRIIVCLILLLMFIQVGGYFVVLQSNRTIATATLDGELETGAQVIDRLLTLRHERIKQASQVLARDFGLRQTLANGDLATVRSMLENHGQRMDASLVILTDPGHQLITAVMPKGGTVPENVDVNVLITASMGARIVALGGEPTQVYQLISTPIMSPGLSARLVLGFALDEAFLRDLGQLNDLDISLLVRSAKGQWEERSSTLSSGVVAHLTANLEQHQSGKWRLDAPGERYQMRSIPLHANDEIELLMVLGLSLERALVPYRKMERVILVMLALGLILSALAVYFVTRNMIAPLNRMAHLDSLTGLANRRLLSLALKRTEAERVRAGTPYAVFMLDLNKFKELNDTHGHATGDLILKEIAQRLRNTLRSTDTIARQGGDEFVVLLPGACEETVERMAEKVVSAIFQPIDIEGDTYNIGISLGVAVASASSTLAPEQLLHLADKALYRAKSSGVGYFLASKLTAESKGSESIG